MAFAPAIAGSQAAGCGTAASGFPTGTWTAIDDAGDVAFIEFASDGTWAPTGASTTISSGMHSTDASAVRFVTDSCCAEVGNEQATYTWVHANERLTLKQQADLCTDRAGVLDGTAWKLAVLTSPSRQGGDLSAVADARSQASVRWRLSGVRGL